MDDNMSEDTDISNSPSDPKTGYDADILALREELASMREEFARTIEEYRTANSDLWARLQTKPSGDSPVPEPQRPTSEDIFNTIMRG